MYQKLPSLTHLILVERDKVLVEVINRDGDALFTSRILEGSGDILDLPAIGVSISLAEIYRDVLTP